MGILDSVAAARATAAAPAADAAKPERPKSEFWLNIGVNIPGAGENGQDLFLTLPSGLALDDMKPAVVRGTNQNYIQMMQAKNKLLEELQQAAATLKPGERRSIPVMTVEVYRKADPDQVGSADTNPLLSGLAAALRGG